MSSPLRPPPDRIARLGLVVALGLLAAACTSSPPDGGSTDTASAESARSTDDETGNTLSSDADADAVGDDGTDDDTAGDDAAGDDTGDQRRDLAAGEFNPRSGFGDPPTIPDRYDSSIMTSLDVIFGAGLSEASFATTDRAALQLVEDTADVRNAWYVADLLRFFGPGSGALVSTAEALTERDLSDWSPWVDLVDHLIAWDIPAPPDYLTYKRDLYTEVLPAWEPFFEDGAGVDYRLWSWGGVGIDDRPFDQTDLSCNCIPAADNPKVTDAAGGDWYDDDRIVFGVEINGERRAYPRNIMEIREMVNDTLGGRDIAMPYCTLCGSAQVYLTDELPAGVDRPVMRTSGLLSRSNKVMYDLNSSSVFDTFTGEALTGPLAELGLQLEQAGVVTTTWGEWKAEHPDTTILAESLALGRESDLLTSRDADGPIFPVGDVDPRLPVQEPVLGVITDSGRAVAFPADEARRVLLDGGEVSFENITVELFGGGIRAVDGAGDDNDAGGHQAFWFAWSQFHPTTEVWSP